MPATANFTNLTNPPQGGLDDGWWNIELPWPIYFLRLPFSYGITNTGSAKIHVTTNGVIGGDFGPYNTGSYGNVGSIVTTTSPSFDKLLIAAADNVVTSFTYKVLGSSPSRKAYIRYEAVVFGNSSAKIIWEVIIPEQESGEETFIDVNIVENGRWGVSGLYGLYYSGGQLIENPTNFGQPGTAYKFDLWNGGFYGRTPAVAIPSSDFLLYQPLPGQSLTSTRNLFISGDSTDFGTGTGVMMIADPGLPKEVLKNPLNYVQNLYFHSGLPYLQITGIRIPNWTLNFPAVNRDITYWEDSGGGKGK
jgi:hypothetical protein